MEKRGKIDSTDLNNFVSQIHYIIMKIVKKVSRFEEIA